MVPYMCLLKLNSRRDYQNSGQPSKFSTHICLCFLKCTLRKVRILGLEGPYETAQWKQVYTFPTCCRCLIQAAGINCQMHGVHKSLSDKQQATNVTIPYEWIMEYGRSCLPGSYSFHSMTWLTVKYSYLSGGENQQLDKVFEDFSQVFKK